MSDLPQDDAPRGPIGRFLATPPDTTSKTIIVAVALCLFCSMIVSVAAVSLRPVQDANRLLDKQRNILQVAGVWEPGIDIAEAFQRFEPRIVDLDTGEFDATLDPTEYDDRAAGSDLTLSTPLEDDPAGIGRRANAMTVYLLNDENGDLDKVILPVHGYGLWSTLYGFIALEQDGNEIYGLQFYEHGETPGLGAEVDNPRWRALWNGKEVYGDEGDLQITVAKGVPSSDMAVHHIDAIAGATLTSAGVDNLVRFWLGEQGFGPFLDRLKTGEI
jgi:Na+-transporting NADH:ubiquinone oxidoreductase subunit C